MVDPEKLSSMETLTPSKKEKKIPKNSHGNIKRYVHTKKSIFELILLNFNS